jgi:hypothetical protein
MATPADATIIIVNDALENLVVVPNELQHPLFRLLAATSGEAGLRDSLGAPGRQFAREIGRFEFLLARHTLRGARLQLESAGRK